MELTGKQEKQLHDALLNAFNESELTMMVRFEMGERLDNIVGDGNLREILLQLIQWAIAKGRIEELINAAHNYNPGNPQLKAFWKEVTSGTPATPTNGQTTGNKPSTPAKQSIKILFLASNPDGTANMHLDEEYRSIQQRIRSSQFQDRIEVESEWAVRPLDLQDALLRHQPDIVHFSSHGNQTEELLLKGDDGKSKPVSKAALQHLFATLKDNVKVVMLNACYSEPQAEAIVQHIPCVIGMSKAIGIESAIKFSASFYLGIGFGRTVLDAFNIGVGALLLEGIAEETIPRIKTQPGADASQLKLIAS